MQAILELNQFQRIVEIHELKPVIEMYYQEPGKVFKITEINKRHAENKSMKRICFYLEGTFGDFLVYKYKV